MGRVDPYTADNGAAALPHTAVQNECGLPMCAVAGLNLSILHPQKNEASALDRLALDLRMLFSNRILYP